MFKFKSNQKKYMKYLCFLFILGLSMLFSRPIFSNAAEEVCKVTFCLNGGVMDDISDLQTLDLTVGSSYTLQSKPTKTGYDFMGWIQQGTEIISPMGCIRGDHALYPSDYDGEFRNPEYRPSNFLQGYCATAGLSEINVQKSEDCKTGVSTYMHRVSITQNAQQSGLYDRIGVSNLAPRTWLANTTYRVTMYVKIPKGYSLSHHWWFPATCNGAGYVNGGSNKPLGSYLDVQGNDEFQLIEFLWNSGSITTPYGSPALVFTQTDSTLPQPSASNPINFDFGYFSYSIANSSIGTTFQNSSTNTTLITAQNTGWDALTAIYEPSTYTITYDANGGISQPASQSYRYKPANNIPLASTNPVKLGCTFLGWSKNKNATEAEYLSNSNWSCGVIGNTTLYAVWKFSGCKILSPKTLILDSNGNCSFKISSVITSGSLQITIPSNITFKQPNKPDLIGTLTISDNLLTALKPSTLCLVKVNGLTAGSWTGQLNIVYKYIP